MLFTSLKLNDLNLKLTDINFLTLIAFIIVAIACMATGKLGRNDTNGGLLGNFQTTGAAIIIVGIPIAMSAVLATNHYISQKGKTKRR